MKTKPCFGWMWWLSVCSPDKVWFGVALPLILSALLSWLFGWQADKNNWFPTDKATVDILISTHFKAVTFVVGFTASIIFIFHEKRWGKNRTETVKEILTETYKYEQLYVHFSSTHNSDFLHASYSEFMVALGSAIDDLTPKFVHIGTVFFANIFFIGLFSCCSVLSVYFAQFAGNYEFYKAGVAMFVFTLPLVIYHIWIVFTPTFTIVRIKKMLEKPKEFFKAHLDDVCDVSSASKKTDFSEIG